MGCKISVNIFACHPKYLVYTITIIQSVTKLFTYDIHLMYPVMAISCTSFCNTQSGIFYLTASALLI